MRLGCVGLVELLEGERLLFFGGVPLGQAELPLDGLHLLPQVAVCFLQRAHLLGQSLDPLLLLKQSFLHRGAEQLPGKEQSTGQLPFSRRRRRKRCGKMDDTGVQRSDSTLKGL